MDDVDRHMYYAEKTAPSVSETSQTVFELL